VSLNLHKIYTGFRELGQLVQNLIWGKHIQSMANWQRHSLPFMEKSSSMKMILQLDRIRFERHLELHFLLKNLKHSGIYRPVYLLPWSSQLCILDCFFCSVYLCNQHSITNHKNIHSECTHVHIHSTSMHIYFDH